MRCELELRSPANGTGTGEHWAFSGKEGRLLLDALEGVAEFAVEAPVEVYEPRRYGHVVRDEERWRAAMLLWPDEPATRQRSEFGPRQADAAWSAEGALALAELLPERLADLAAALRARFGSELSAR